MKTKTYDFRSFCNGNKVRTDNRQINTANDIVNVPLLSVLLVPFMFADWMKVMAKEPEAVSVVTSPGTSITIDHAFDPVITMLQQTAFPVATICIAWACLEAMIGKPASAVSRAKWAALGYIAMRYAPDLLRHI